MERYIIFRNDVSVEKSSVTLKMFTIYFELNRRLRKNYRIIMLLFLWKKCR